MGWIPALNLAILLLYSLECLVRLFAEQCLFWWNRWNLTDFVIVLSGWLDFIFADVLSVNLLRMSRLIRVSRAVRLLISIPEFYLLINGLYSSIKAILFGALLLVAMIVVWAVIAVQLLHPITSTLEKYYLHCERCPRGFSTVFQAGLTLFQQLVAGDSWGTINLQLVEEAPWTMIILLRDDDDNHLGALEPNFGSAWACKGTFVSKFSGRTRSPRSPGPNNSIQPGKVGWVVGPAA